MTRRVYIAILINAAIFLWFAHTSASAYVTHFTDDSWLAFGPGLTEPTWHLQLMRWSALAIGLLALFARRPEGVALLVACHVFLASYTVGAVLALHRYEVLQLLPTRTVIGFAMSVALSLLGSAAALWPGCRQGLAGRGAIAREHRT